MKISKVHAYWIVTQSIFAILACSLHVLWLSFFKKCPRGTIDRLSRQLGEKLLSFIDLRYSVANTEYLHYEPHRRYIIMCNHASHYDIPLSMAVIPGSLRMLVKKELCRVPIWGRAMKAGEYVSIDRNDRHQAKKDLELAKQKMESGLILWMAPEGTRSRTGELQPFKKGGFLLAFQTDAIIIPMSIRGAFNVLPPKTLDFHLHQHVEIRFSQPIDTKNYSIRERERLMKDVEHAIRQAI